MKPKTTKVKAVVNRAQVVATVKKEIEEGKTPHEAVKEAFEKHEVKVATPALARDVAQATHRKVLIPATDGYYHDGRTKQEEAAIGAHTKRIFQLFNALEAIATLPEDLQALANDVPEYSAHRVNKHLDKSIEILGRFKAIWETCKYAHDTGMYRLK